MGKGSRTESQRAASDRRTLPWTLGSIVVLALVIYGTSALTSAKEPPENSAHTASVQAPADPAGSAARSESLYQQALEAQRSGDATHALELAAQAVQVNPNNAKAKQLVEVIAAAPAANPSTGGSNSNPAVVPASAPTQPRVSDIATLLPKTISGYSFGTPQVVKTDAVLSADPVAQSGDASRVSTVLFSVHDRDTAAAAKKWVDTVNKRVYSQDRVAVTIAGGPGYFGTDGVRLASAVFARGPYVFELILTVSQGKPLAAKDVALRLADAFPVKR